MSLIERRDGDTPFDMRMAFFDEVHKLRIHKDQCAVLGDLEGWLNTLEQIYIKVEFLFYNRKVDSKKKKVNGKTQYTKQSIELLEESEKVGKALKILRNELDENITSRAVGADQYIRLKLLKIDKSLNRLLDQKGMIMPRKQVKDGLEVYSKEL